MSERLTHRLVDRHGGPSRAALTASAALVAAAFIVAFLAALGSTGSEPQRPAGAATALREAASPKSASRTVELRAVAALPDLRRHQRPRHALPFATNASEPSAPEPVNSAPEPTTAASPPAAPATPPPAPPAPEPLEPSQPQPSFDSAGEFDSSG